MKCSPKNSWIWSGAWWTGADNKPVRQLTTIAVPLAGTAGAQSGEQEALGPATAAGQESFSSPPSGMLSAQRLSRHADATQNSARKRKRSATSCLRWRTACVMFATSGEVESRLRAREVQLNDAERKEKPATSSGKSRRSRLQLLRRRHRLLGCGAQRLNRQAGLGHVKIPPVSVKLRDREAAARASQQRERQQSQAAETSVAGN